MPKLSKPIQGLIVLVLACLVGAVVFTMVRNNEDEGFLGLVELETTDGALLSPTEEPVETTQEPAPIATEEPLATAEPSDGTGGEPTTGSSPSGGTTQTVSHPTPFGADFNIVFQWFMVLALLFGASFAVRKDFTTHRNIMTFLVLVNVFSILGRMSPNVDGYLDTPDPAGFEKIAIWIHAIGGGIIAISGIYLLIRMWFEKKLPAWFLVKNFKLQMRATLLLWLILIALGTFMYFDIYG
ncbi:MAG: hypothetical protein K8L91_06290 [Anaerolineae bacterium]|nr:hypothetical protein [Anaerolineae bacterium]